MTPTPSRTLRPLTTDDADAAAAVVAAAIDAHIAPDWSAVALARLRPEVDAARLRVRIPSATICLGSFDGPGLAGLLLMPSPATVALLFVHPAHERRGHARALWTAARDALAARHPEVAEVRLNATPYARPVYERLGFRVVSAPFDVDGARATRMACLLHPSAEATRADTDDTPAP